LVSGGSVLNSNAKKEGNKSFAFRDL